MHKARLNIKLNITAITLKLVCRKFGHMLHVSAWWWGGGGGGGGRGEAVSVQS